MSYSNCSFRLWPFTLYVCWYDLWEKRFGIEISGIHNNKVYFTTFE